MKNFEKYKSAQNRNEAFGKWCRDNYETWCNTNDKSCTECQFEWLDLEVEKEEPLPCPYCGKDVEIRTKGDYDTWNQAQCTCGYRGSWWSDKDKAISAHNRVARAVMENKGE